MILTHDKADSHLGKNYTTLEGPCLGIFRLKRVVHFMGRRIILLQFVSTLQHLRYHPERAKKINFYVLLCFCAHCHKMALHCSQEFRLHANMHAQEVSAYLG